MQTSIGKVIAIGVGLLLSTSCGLLDFDIDQEIPETIVMGSVAPDLPAIGVDIFPPLSMTIDMDQELEQQNASGVSSAHISTLQLYITDTAKSDSSDEDTFDFLEQITLYIEGEDTDLYPREKLAWIEDIAEGSTELNFEVNDNLDLVPYISETNSTIISEVVGFIPPDDISYEGNMVITISPF